MAPSLGMDPRLKDPSPKPQASYAERYEHVMVDEFQDTSAVQCELVPPRCLPAMPRHLSPHAFQDAWGQRSSSSPCGRSLSLAGP